MSYSLLSFAQDTLQNRIRHINLGLALCFSNSYDAGASPLLYSGTGPGLFTGFEKHKNTHFSSLDFTLNYTLEKHTRIKPYSRSSVNTIFFMLSNSEAWQIMQNKSQKFLFYLGFDLRLIGDLRIFNNYGNNDYNFAASLSPGIYARAEYPFEFLAKRWKANGSLTIPVVSIWLRPDYSYSLPEGFQKREDSFMEQAINSLRVGFWNQTFYTVFDFELEYFLKNNNAFSAGYCWTFFEVSPGYNTYISVRHQFYVQSKFHF
jgi:hypothetical protein